jgi:hypothetical protein
MRDERVRAALERLPAAPERHRFFEELWERIDATERAAARRWRAAALVAVTVAIAGTAAAGVLAFGRAGGATVDRTLSCPVPQRKLVLFAHVKGPSIFVRQAAYPHGKLVPRPALVELDAGRYAAANMGITQVYETTLAGAYAGASITQRAGYTLDGSVCRAAAAIPFTPGGLHPAGVFTGTQAAGVYKECPTGLLATFRMRVTLAKSGLPVAAKLIVRGVAYVDWTPTRIRAWLAPSCQQYTDLAP